MGVELASTPLVDPGKSEHFPVAKRLEGIDVLHVGESLAEMGALLVVESSVEVGMFLCLEREFVDVHGCFPYLN